MRDEIQEGKDWIEETIKQCSSVDVEIEWEVNDDFGPPGPSGIRNVKSFYRVAVITPKGQRGTERISPAGIEDCGDDKELGVRRQVRQQILGLLARLGIAN